MMTDRFPLFPAFDAYTDREPTACGFYDLIMPDAYRWMEREATLYLPNHEAQSFGRPALAIQTTFHGFSWLPFLSIEINQRYLGTQPIANFGTYYFAIPPGDEALAGELKITLRVNHHEQAPQITGMEWLSLPLYSVQLLDLDQDFPERVLLREQISAFDPNYYPLPAALKKLNEFSRILDIGAGAGWSTFLLAAYSGARAVGVDLQPYDRTRGQAFKDELAERLARHGSVFQATPGFQHLHDRPAIDRIVNDQCSFYCLDAQQTMFRDGWFDFVFSLNAFEHIPDPGLVLREIARLLRPGAEALIMFHLPYYCDGGSHLQACGLVDRPWVQLLHSREEIRRMVVEAGRVPNEIARILDSLNGWTLQQYRDALRESGLQVLLQQFKQAFTVPGAGASPEFEQVKQSYPLEDLMTAGVVLHLRKE